MRAFSDKQTDVFLNVFGETISINGATCTGIVDVRPVVIDSGTEGLIESTETFISMKSLDVTNHGIEVDSILKIKNINYTVYNIYDDLSGVSEVYVRPTVINNFGV
ncbi:hypothetical protein E0539_11790 [Salmonella enterica subsp. enterica serovar Tilene]|uniref:hypothetical protein n=1 Tax=Salmonella enterica TaxID=28901 RepID=UPI00126C1D6C|nr:hypothetical protein [Salmonella enterica]ECF1326716.1 hypothetical protein [Salmonella enterica subsp. enterica serovar Tilene]EEL5713519.1 hypothetical protein [Salmonella enterica subsp. enterica serovar Rubislaw]HCB5333323.1 hypothetical protein [Salmonella enterica subsp. enterica serovar Rubislaw]HCB5341615.1 hypothetical protein [Salmonella enterica subsp. enterica serovar Rubislaw]